MKYTHRTCIENWECKNIEQRFDEIYQSLVKACDEYEGGIENLEVVIFLTGFIHALRIFNDYKVPEMEHAFRIIREASGKEITECLPKF